MTTSSIQEQREKVLRNPELVRALDEWLRVEAAHFDADARKRREGASVTQDVLTREGELAFAVMSAQKRTQALIFDLVRQAATEIASPDQAANVAETTGPVTLQGRRLTPPEATGPEE